MTHRIQMTRHLNNNLTWKSLLIRYMCQFLISIAQELSGGRLRQSNYDYYLATLSTFNMGVCYISLLLNHYII